MHTRGVQICFTFLSCESCDGMKCPTSRVTWGITVRLSNNVHKVSDTVPGTLVSVLKGRLSQSFLCHLQRFYMPLSVLPLPPMTTEKASRKVLILCRGFPKYAQRSGETQC